jgi:hypothetical protein
VSPDTRPDRHALLELQALLAQIAVLRAEGDADRFTADDRYRWVLHRLWIAAGNEGLDRFGSFVADWEPEGVQMLTALLQKLEDSKAAIAARQRPAAGRRWARQDG